MASNMGAAQMFAASLVNQPTRCLLLENMLKAQQVLDDEERGEVRPAACCCSACREPSRLWFSSDTGRSQLCPPAQRCPMLAHGHLQSSAPRPGAKHVLPCACTPCKRGQHVPAPVAGLCQACKGACMACQGHQQGPCAAAGGCQG